MCEHGLGSIQVDLGGIATPESASSKMVSSSGYLTKNTTSYLKICSWSMIPGMYLSFLVRS